MTKYRLLAGTAIIAGSALAGSQAMAFDRVDWSWTLDANTEIDTNVDVDVDIDPTGYLGLEKFQIHIGDLTATSNVSGIYNNQPSGEGQTIEVPLTLTLDGDVSTTGIGVDSFAGAEVTDEDDNVLASVSDTVSGAGINPGGNFDATADFVVSVEIPGEATSFDALTELPEVVSTATAVANNQSIETEVATEIHDGQYAFDAAEDPSLVDALGTLGGGLLFAHLEHQGINTGLSMALGLTTAATLGGLEKAQISATSTVDDILNASVDSAATAVANNMSVELDAVTSDDAYLLADVNQFAYADLTAMSSVSNVNVNNYTNLGALDRPLVSSVATAVGNNLSITVDAPRP